MQNEYLKLLIKRESSEVLGKRFANLWLLSLVLFATFVSIAFSNGSLKYLSYKMNDPFTNWVNISNGYGSSQFSRFQSAIEDPEIQQHYCFSDVQADKQFSLSFIGKDGRIHYLQNRFFGSLNSALVQAILGEDNVVGNSAVLTDKLKYESVGFIITEDVLHQLNYTEENIPAYIDFLSASQGADTLGVEIIEKYFAAAPMPILGVVKRLPGNVDMIASRYFYEQYNNERYPFDLNNLDYQKSLLFFVDSSVSQDELKATIVNVAPDSLKRKISIFDGDEAYSQLASWKNGKIYSVYIDDINLLPVQAVQDIAKGVIDHYNGSVDIKRLYDYNGSEHTLSEYDFLSVNFNSLDSIRAFEAFAKQNFNVLIEMSQVNAKENFNSVSIMANILSWAMIVFSMICIIMFIINMLQSYFQKVKRNIGTFKAFGISSIALVNVYSFIIVMIVLVAIILAFSLSWIVQEILPLIGFVKDGEFNYLSLWSMKTAWAIVIVISSTMLTVKIVMSRLLRSTPGDLIYDR